MILWLFAMLVFINTSFASIGFVTSVNGQQEAFILRNKSKITLSEGSPLMEGDILQSQGDKVQILLYPSIQMNLAKKSSLNIVQHKIKLVTQKDLIDSKVSLSKGVSRVQVMTDPSFQLGFEVGSEDVSFLTAEGEFEVSQNGKDAELDVLQGEVEVTSPHIQTFVPEIVKAREGFKFKRQPPAFLRKKLSLEYTPKAPFLTKTRVQELWKKKRQEMLRKK